MNRDVARAHNSTVQQRWDTTSSSNPMTNTQVPVQTSPDARNVSDDRIQTPRTRNRHPDFESTADGDVVIVQPSFDDDGRGTQASSSKNGWQDEGKHGDCEARTPSDPLKDQSASKRHTRNLSAHFFDATSISRNDSPDPSDTFADDDALDNRKHRRMTSGGVSNPNTAHRRLDSRGGSAPVQRHHRVLSAGLDILSAAANATSEELEQAAGRKAVNWSTQPLQNPPPAQSHVPLHGPSMQQGYRSFPPPNVHPPPGGHGMPPPTHDMRRFGGPAPQPSPYYPPHAPSPAGYGGQPEYSCYYPPYGRPEYQTEQFPTQHSMYPPTKMYPPEARSSGATTDPNAVRSWTEPQRATQGSQTFVTAMAVGSNRTMRPNQNDVPTHVTQHHRRMSSYSSLGLGTIFGGAQATSPERGHPLKGKSGKQSHHRSTSSSISFLNSLDVAGMTGATDETFIRSLHEASSTGTEHPKPLAGSVCVPIAAEVKSSVQSASSVDESPKKLAPGLAASKRVRRKCTIGGCPNRVVQGGLCISHGAKRKTCKHHGCNKNVKKAGLCSTHGPARKRCDVDDCQKVAVQGGRCIAHGAKKKLCSVDDCTKQAILSGMCKKHHDQAAESKKIGKKYKSKTHHRGLSIFAEISADTVQTIINADAITEASAEKSEQQSW